MRQQIRIKDLFTEDPDTHGTQLLAGMILTAECFTDTIIAQQADSRILTFFKNYVISPVFADDSAGEIRNYIQNYLNSITYKLDGLYNSTMKEYDPISNYDMTEDSEDNTTASADGDGSSKSTAWDTTTGRLTDETDAHSESESNNTHHLERKGNIGVTTTQQMLEQERNITDFDFVGIVVNEVISNFCCLVSPSEGRCII